MQMKCSKLAAGTIAGILLTNTASAHPGHAQTDIVAQLSLPFAGVDHFVVFVAVTSGLLLLLRSAVKHRDAAKGRVQR